MSIQSRVVLGRVHAQEGCVHSQHGCIRAQQVQIHAQQGCVHAQQIRIHAQQGGVHAQPSRASVHALCVYTQQRVPACAERSLDSDIRERVRSLPLGCCTGHGYTGQH